MKNITKNNKLIAEFMGFESDPHFTDYYSKFGEQSFSIKEGDPIKCCKYHNDLLWLNPVVIQCYLSGLKNTKYETYVKSGFRTNNLKLIYKGVIDFIKNYGK